MTKYHHTFDTTEPSPGHLPTCLPRPSALRRTARSVNSMLTFLAVLSAPPAAVFGYLAWASPDMTVTAKHAGDLVALKEKELARRDEEIELMRGVLKGVVRLLPPSERASLGVERLVEITERRMAEEAAEAQRRKEAGRTPSVPSAGKRSPAREASAASRPETLSEKAKHIWDGIEVK